MAPKRKVCPNPLFLLWLQEWKQDAEEKGLNSKWTYGKAIASLKKYPLPLRSGKEVKILENVGDGIARKLDDRLKEYLQNGGDISDLHPINPINVDASPNKRKRVVKKKPDIDDPVNVSSIPNIKSPNTQKYIPKYRSGPYALIIALYEETQKPASIGYLSKDELQQKSQHLCDTSMTLVVAGTHYTAWSSMGTLVSKGLVVKTSSPAKYFITESGCRLACTLLKATNNTPLQSRPIASPLNKSAPDERLALDVAQNQSPKTQVSSYKQNIKVNSPERVIDNPDSSQLSKLKYWYVQVDDKTTIFKTKALVTIDDVVGLGFLIKARKHDLESSGALFMVDTKRSATSDGYMFAYIADKNSDEISEPPSKHNITIPESVIPAISKSTTGHTLSTKNLVTPTTSKPTTLINSHDIFSHKTVFSSTNTSTLSNPTNKNKTKTNEDVDIIFTLKPGMFDVILCVDVVETTGSGKRKKEMADKLISSGVNMQVRKLQLGDFLWIAKEKFGTQRELVLDFIVERKRMDDLASSICDGRFREQKFRLKSCGLKKKIYLVEQHGSVKHFVVPETTLHQAVMNTQVIDGFFVQETNDITSSVQYLALMTTQVASLYQNKTLHAVSMDTCKNLKSEPEFEKIISDSNQHLFTFDEFHTRTNKNKLLTVREIFTKQLMQLKGVSVDRAIAITQNYPTPYLLVSAFNSCLSLNDKENLLTNVEYGDRKKKIGAAISKQVCILYNTLNS